MIEALVGCHRLAEGKTRQDRGETYIISTIRDYPAQSPFCQEKNKTGRSNLKCANSMKCCSFIMFIIVNEKRPSGIIARREAPLQAGKRWMQRSRFERGERSYRFPSLWCPSDLAELLRRMEEGQGEGELRTSVSVMPLRFCHFERMREILSWSGVPKISPSGRDDKRLLRHSTSRGALTDLSIDICLHAD